MKNYYAILSSVLVFFLLTACQQEETTTLTAKDANAELPDKTLTFLTQISVNDGSHDNIIDGASCIELKLPLTVNVNNNPVTIEDNSDFDTIELLLEEDTDDDDSIFIDFPIEIVLEDHTVVSVNDLAALNEYINQCEQTTADGDDGDIESVDFIYPIYFPLLDINAGETSMTRVSSDKELHAFMKGMTPSLVVGLDFPVTLVLSDGEEIVITSYEVLENTVEVAEITHDDDDDLDFNDDDQVNMSEDEFINYITQCGYVIDKLIVDGQAHQTSYQGYHFEFYEYGNVATACIGTELSVGTWDVTTVNDNLRFEIAIDDLPFINRNWIVHNFEETEVSFGLRLGEDILDFNMDCIDQTPDIIALLSSDTWTVYYLEVADINQTQTLSNYSFNFGDNDVVTAVNQETQEVEYGS